MVKEPCSQVILLNFFVRIIIVQFSHFPLLLSLRQLKKRKEFAHIYGLFGWRGEGEEAEKNRVKLTKNKLILC